MQRLTGNAVALGNLDDGVAIGEHRQHRLVLLLEQSISKNGG
jgi:hypothetical protein